VGVAAALPLSEGVAVKNTLAATREEWAHWTRRPQGHLSEQWPVAGAGLRGLPPRWTVAGAGLRGLSPRLLLYAALAGELGAAVYLLACGNVSPVLVRSLQLFLRF
jgi:hypothetical protein